MLNNKTQISLAIFASVALAACGGGGGSTATAPVVPVAAPVAAVVQASSLVNTVPTATYAAGSEELAAFNKLNAERTNCGFGKLARILYADHGMDPIRRSVTRTPLWTQLRRIMAIGN